MNAPSYTRASHHGVADPVLFPRSDRARYATGVALDVNGGRSIGGARSLPESRIHVQRQTSNIQPSSPVR